MKYKNKYLNNKFDKLFGLNYKHLISNLIKILLILKNILCFIF